MIHFIKQNHFEFPKMATVDHPVMLVVLDGWGYSESSESNAIRAADTPTWDRLWREYPRTLISASGRDVGLPDEQMGNSEVGHMHIGAGRLIPQDYTRISSEIDSGVFENNPALAAAFATAGNNDGAVHILGLLSPGGVHSHEEHILALMAAGKKVGRQTPLPPRLSRRTRTRRRKVPQHPCSGSSNLVTNKTSAKSPPLAVDILRWTAIRTGIEPQAPTVCSSTASVLIPRPIRLRP